MVSPILFSSSLPSLLLQWPVLPGSGGFGPLTYGGGAIHIIVLQNANIAAYITADAQGSGSAGGSVSHFFFFRGVALCVTAFTVKNFQ